MNQKNKASLAITTELIADSLKNREPLTISVTNGIPGDSELIDAYLEGPYLILVFASESFVETEPGNSIPVIKEPVLNIFRRETNEE